ncbi:NADH:ubiquinone reductase (Na(+)-transporting) subunit E [Flavobacteriales bacterium]|jgi:Na+-transporting NADH:ubiquinone oxidoreductase subunit E|nr:NADH:ubiquinone reductase (Na(+)-transporting) subunit E [Flavobacteriales bacterium]MDB4196097.1 NADH:ubiquinone reductase (Na(+)-transporting) subunit E [Flavobacteriales bacterium]MDB9702205.1 NADH:ubiquinone reductase (Na(+)-transporting) subunit E [Flavobacteriales bacterium]MDC0015176.1 NADH:ubiquinone reductase (Na(+)-transporting) subunit E [Flavobacteriales bacterium]MDG1175246.1 NADH:ubiquinone reductase (Na(+)-transporting) subunit E [Flavobacteriales bacterium]|tara:strand:+ start:763 stop:1377 length:615 start_codon:yes stop_codon:yes gene_type:complete
MELLKLFIRAAFVDNMVFTFFFGMCSYLAVSKTVKTAFGLGLAVIFVLVVTVPVNYLLEMYVLKDGALAWMGPEYADIDLSFLSFIMFIAVIASIVQLVEMVVEKFSPSLYGALGIFLPLIAVNCAILGGSLFMQQKNFPTIGHATVYGLGSGFGWFIAIVLLAAIRERLKYANIPAPLRGVGMAFLITGLMGLAFLGFLGFNI